MRVAFHRRRASDSWLGRPGPVVSELLADAEAEAVRSHHAFIGSEHLLLVLVSGSDVAGRALRRFGLDVDAVREDVQRIVDDGPTVEQPLDAEAPAVVGIDLDAVREQVDASFGEGALERSQQRRGDRGAAGFGIAPGVKRRLEAARLAASARGASAVDRADVLRALADEDTCLAAQILRARGIEREALASALATARSSEP